MKRFDGFMFGANLGGWLSQFDEDTKEHFDSFITEKDIVRIKEAGFDHVRVPVDYVVIEDEQGEPIESGYEYLENCVEWCSGADAQDLTWFLIFIRHMVILLIHLIRERAKKLFSMMRNFRSVFTTHGTQSQRDLQKMLI